VTQDLDRATDVLREASAAIWEDPTWHDALLGDPTVAGVETIEADHLLLRVIARTLPGKQFDVGHALRFRIAVSLQRAGIAAPVSAPATTGS
jgi:small conductance mechanosensitive channel